jgi:hypothetical protein
MDASSTFDINIGVLDTGITAGPSTIIPVNVSNDSATGADGSASNVQVSFGGFKYNMLTVSQSQMDVSSTLDINIGVLNTGIMAGPPTIIPVNVSNDSATGADGSASNVQVGF